jgi:hypothetical protein
MTEYPLDKTTETPARTFGDAMLDIIIDRLVREIVFQPTPAGQCPCCGYPRCGHNHHISD